MSNFAVELKREISRLAAREVRKGTPVLKRSSARFRREIAALKREIRMLEKRINFLLKNASSAQPVQARNTHHKIRFSATWLGSHRKKLKLSAQNYGKPRASCLERLAAIRGLRQRSAHEKLRLNNHS